MATVDDLNEDLQKQSVDAAVELWEIELSSSTSAYFFSGLDSDLDTVDFRDRVTPATIRTYEALPILGEGFSQKSDGPSARPKLTVANILDTFSGALGDLTNKDLLGKKIYRRRTLEKYLHPTDTSSPPVEMPIQMYYIDRISDQSILSVTFELASPFDVGGIQLPKRVILGNACSWEYQGSASSKAIQNRRGACSWATNRQLVDQETGTVHTHSFNKDDEPIFLIPTPTTTPTITITEYTSGAVDQDKIYKTAADTTNLRKVNADKTTSAPGTVYDYWQAMAANDAPGTPSDTNPAFRRVRIAAAYDAATTYTAYTDPRRNEIALSGGTLYQVRETTEVGGSHSLSSNKWFNTDQCSKSLTGCILRYCARSTNPGSEAYRTSVLKIRDKELPFGGFPGIKA